MNAAPKTGGGQGGAKASGGKPSSADASKRGGGKAPVGAGTSQSGKPSLSAEALANKIRGAAHPAKQGKQTVVVYETKEGAKIVTFGGEKPTEEQLKAAREAGLVVGEYEKGIHGEPMGLISAGKRYLPTGGYSTNNVCDDCRDQLSEAARQGGYKLVVLEDKKTFVFEKQ